MHYVWIVHAVVNNSAICDISITMQATARRSLKMTSCRVGTKYEQFTDSTNFKKANKPLPKVKNLYICRASLQTMMQCHCILLWYATVRRRWSLNKCCMDINLSHHRKITLFSRSTVNAVLVHLIGSVMKWSHLTVMSYSFSLVTIRRPIWLLYVNLPSQRLVCNQGNHSVVRKLVFLQCIYR